MRLRLFGLAFSVMVLFAGLPQDDDEWTTDYIDAWIDSFLTAANSFHNAGNHACESVALDAANGVSNARSVSWADLPDDDMGNTIYWSDGSITIEIDPAYDEGENLMHEGLHAAGGWTDHNEIYDAVIRCYGGVVPPPPP